MQRPQPGARFVGTARRAACAAAVLFWLGTGGQAAGENETSSEFQRTQVDRTASHRVVWGLSAVIDSETTPAGARTAVNGVLEATYTAANRFVLAAAVPGLAIIEPISVSGKRVVRLRAGPGDPTAKVGLRFGSAGHRWDLGLAYAYPLGRWNPYEFRARTPISGSGYHRLTGTAGFLRIRDPVVWLIRLSYGLGLGRRERFVTTVRPANLGLDVALVEVMNDRFALQFGTEVSVEFPPTPVDALDLGVPDVTVSVAGTVLWNRKPLSLRLGAMHRLSSPLDGDLLVAAELESLW
jgi:hypothetical protein